MTNMRRMMRVGLAMMVASLMVVATGCDDDDGGDPIGNVTIQGNIIALDELAIVSGGVPEVVVKIKGTSHTATTADDGVFVIAGVAPGTYTLIIVHGGTEIEYDLGEVPDGTRVEVSNIRVLSSGRVAVSKVELHNLDTGKKTTVVDNSEDTINVAGNWKFSYESLSAVLSREYQLVLTQSGSDLGGSVLNVSRTLEGNIDGNNIELVVTVLAASRTPPERLSGTVNDSGTAMSGTWTSADDSGTWSAVPGTVDPR